MPFALMASVLSTVYYVVSSEWNELADKAKDAEAGTVLVIAFATGTIGVIVYVRALLRLKGGW